MEVPAKFKSTLVGLRYSLVAFLIVATSAFLMSCGTSSSKKITKGPDNITITVSSETALPGEVITVVATVVNDNEDPLEWATVEFLISPNNSNGILSALSGITDFNGNISITYTAGPDTGVAGVNDTITATVSIQTLVVSGNVTIAVEPPPAPEVGFIELNPSSSALLANGTDFAVLRAEVRDTTGQLMENIEVTFTSTLGTISGSPAATNINGIAEAILTAGTTVGTATVVAQADGFSAEAVIAINPGPPADLTILVAPDTIGSGGTTTVTVTVEDAGENPIVGAKVIFSIDTNNSGGSFASLEAVTDVNGEAVGSYTAGPSEGTDTLRARADSNHGITDDAEVTVEAPVIAGAIVVDLAQVATGTGTLEVGLTDASTDDYQAVYATIAEVQVKKQDQGEGEAGWETVMTPAQTYNLLELVNGTIATLGVGELEAGQYGQMRLLLGELPEIPETNILGDLHPYANYLIDGQDDAIELKVPSGYQSGIKIVEGFTVVTSQATELILDFDAARSVVQPGKSGKYLLKPFIKMLETVENSVSGEVNDGAGPIGGASVSAQVHDSGAAEPKDAVTVEAATVSTEEGVFKLFLAPDTYNIVASRDGYLPACQELEAQFFEEYIADFSLLAETGSFTISGTVSGLATDEDSALLSIRQTIDCGSGDVTIEVASISLAEGGNYSITLPADTYDVVASAAGETTQVFEEINADTELDIVFDL